MVERLIRLDDVSTTCGTLDESLGVRLLQRKRVLYSLSFASVAYVRSR